MAECDRYFHLYGTKDGFVFEEVVQPERKKGKWILTHDFDNIRDAMKPLGRVVYCSECSYPTNMVATNFCPYCGADMRTEREDDGQKGDNQL